jgi:hypothetical protein
MTKHELDEARLSRSMRRLMELKPPQLEPSRRHATHVLGTVALGVATLVAMAGVLTISIVLHNQSKLGVATATPASSPAPAGVALSPTPSKVVTGVLSTPLVYPGSGAQLDPPGALLPSLSAATVLGSCSRPQSNVTCETGQPKSIELGLLTDTGMQIRGELVWAMTWTNVSCDLMGPQHRPSPNPRVNDATGCDLVTFVDAMSGVNPEAIRGAFGL